MDYIKTIFLQSTKTACCSVALMLSISLTTGCHRSGDEVWNDTKTAGRHVSRGAKSLGGKQSSSREVQDGSEFTAAAASPSGYNNDFVAFEDDQDAMNLSLNGSSSITPPNETPGELGSSIPGIEAFKDPAQDPELAMIFEHVHFDYNSGLIKSDENIAILQKIQAYMKDHPGLYIFVEGHCDKRGPAAYNFALGANRSNSVRTFLIEGGANQDHIFTISYGKEKPLFDEEGEEFHQLNRRCQFKVYGQ